MLYAESIRAERSGGAIVVDALSNEDLASHTALVATKDAKQYIRFGDTGAPWLRCE